MEGFFLTPGKMAALNRIIEREMRRPIVSRSRYTEPPEVVGTTEFYVAYVPEGGIPALDLSDTGTTTDDVPGSAVCDIFKFKFYDPDGTVGTAYDEGWYMVPAGFSKRVFNVGTAEISAGQWVPIAKEKFGHWVATAIPVDASSGFNLTVEETDGDPHGENIDTIQIDPATMRLELPAPGVARIFSLANGITVVDDHTGVPYHNVTKLTFISTPSTYNPDLGDWVFTVLDPGTGSGDTGMDLGVRLNGRTADMTPFFACIDGFNYYRVEHFSNGLWKTEGPLTQST